MSSVFVSYRREDSAGWAGHLTSDLRRHFGSTAIFHDIHTIDPGEDFASRIARALETCRVAIVIIGPSWATVRDESGLRRLDEPNDFVRVEIATALQRQNVRVIPVLVGGATLPTPEELPADLQKLLQRHVFELSDERWDHDLERLIAAIGKVVNVSHARSFVSRLIPAPRVLWPILISLTVLGSVWLMTGRQRDEPSITRTSLPTTVTDIQRPQGDAAAPSTLASGKGVVIARGFVRGCSLVEPRIDTTSVATVGTLRVDIQTGTGPSMGSFELYREGDESFKDAPDSGHLAHVYNVGRDNSATMRYNFERREVFRLCASGSWYSPVGATNTFTFRAWIEPLAEFPRP